MTGYLRRLAERATGAVARPAVEPVLRRFEPIPDDPLPDLIPLAPAAPPPVARRLVPSQPGATDTRAPVAPAEPPAPPRAPAAPAQAGATSVEKPLSPQP
ncbi:MAG: hypothetical protein ACK4GT_15055, partial [Pararhodobacter sp.]